MAVCIGTKVWWALSPKRKGEAGIKNPQPGRHHRQKSFLTSTPMETEYQGPQGMA